MMVSINVLIKKGTENTGRESIKKQGKCNDYKITVTRPP